MNKAQIIGRLGADPDTRYTKDGTAVANIRVATSEKFKNKNGEKQERTEWHNVVFFGRLAEVVTEYLRKGSQVYVEGRLQTEKWQDRDGHDRYTTKIIAMHMEMLGNNSRQQPPTQQATHTRQQPTDEPPEFVDDEIPF